MRISVLCGGDGGEREVSLRSGERVAQALRAAGCEVALTVLSPDTAAWPTEIGREAEAWKRADALFLTLHGGGGEDGRLQGLLEAEGLFHYTGSGPAGSAVAMDKQQAKALAAEAGVPVAAGAMLTAKGEHPPLEYPFIVKPDKGGSSLGLALVQNRTDWQKLDPSGGILCEAYLPGREFTVGILGESVLPAVEIRPFDGCYDYAHKYTLGASAELCPAPVRPAFAATLSRLARTAFDALGLRDYARIDFKCNGAGAPVFLEANTLPGMTATSLFPLAAAAAGLSLSHLCLRMAAMAAERKG